MPAAKFLSNFNETMDLSTFCHPILISVFEILTAPSGGKFILIPEHQNGCQRPNFCLILGTFELSMFCNTSLNSVTGQSALWYTL